METFPRNKIFVDVILPNYNKAEFLEEAINSVITQTYKNWHLYIVDDHSEDNTLKLLLEEEQASDTMQASKKFKQ